MSKNMAVITDSGEVENIIVCQDDQPETPNLITYTDANPACIGGVFISSFFYLPQPYPSWTAKDGQWIPPKPRPEAEGSWQWNEDEQEWQD